MIHLKNEEIIFADNGEPIKIVRLLGVGGHGEVYEVEYKGERKAFKYFTNVSEWHEKIYDCLKVNINLKSPSQKILLPEAITKKPMDFSDINNNCFGYVIELIPRDFVSLFDCLSNRKYFLTMKKRLEICLSIIRVFEMLQNSGLQINYFDDSSIYINIESSEVLLYEPEKISKTKQNFQIAYPQRYLAPEMITDNAEPSVYTTEYCVSVILFMLIFGTHPLEGKKWIVPVLTYKNQQDLYGYNPIFIADPNDESNKPNEDIHREFIMLWEQVPEYLKKFFIDAFSSERLHNPKMRLSLSTYKNVFEKYLNDIKKCKCNGLSFRDNKYLERCVFCGKTLE